MVGNTRSAPKLLLSAYEYRCEWMTGKRSAKPMPFQDIYNDRFTLTVGSSWALLVVQR
jgi:hypothetical protein